MSKKDSASKRLPIKEKEAALFQAFEFAAIGMAIVDLDGRWVDVNHSLCDIVGYSREELLSKTFQEITYPDDLQTDLEYVQALMMGHIPYYHMEKRYYHKSGHLVWILLSATLVRNKQGQPLYFVSQIQDIDERKKTETTLEQQKNLLQSIFQHAGVGIIVTNITHQVLYVNPTLCQLLEYSEKELYRQSFQSFLSMEDALAYENYLNRAKVTMSSVDFERTILKRSGDTFWGQIILSFIEGRGSNESRWIHIVTDMTELKQKEQQMRQQAYYDALTGLPNRFYFFRQLNEAIRNAADRCSLLAVLFMDLNGFKDINDSEGHEIGDAILRAVAKRFSSVLGQNDVLARLGGDEFVVLMPVCESILHIENQAKKLLHSLISPIILQGRLHSLSCSLGIALYPEHAEHPQQLMACADSAMYEAKNSLDNLYNYAFFDVETQKRKTLIAGTRFEIEDALNKNELFLVYQPYFDLNTGVVRGVEALLRWQHPKKGLLQPKDFLPFLSKTRYMALIDEWVLKTVYAQSQAWHQRGIHMLTSINMTSSFLKTPHFLKGLEDLTKDLPKVPLCFEINLTKLSGRKHFYIALMKHLKNLGFGLALDEFGSGGAIQLQLLNDIPFDVLKLDKEMVRLLKTSSSLPSNKNVASKAKSFLKTFIDLGKVFQADIVAVGIETKDQYNMLKTLGCNSGQGHYFTKPLDISSLENILCLKPSIVPKMSEY